MNQQILDDVGLDQLDFLDFLIVHYLLMHDGLLIVHIHDRDEALLIRDVEFLVLAVPEYGGVHALIRVPDGEEFGVIRRIEALQVLVVADGEDEVRLHHDQNLYDAYPVRRLVQLLVEGEYAFSDPPLIRCFELEYGAL